MRRDIVHGNLAKSDIDHQALWFTDQAQVSAGRELSLHDYHIEARVARAAELSRDYMELNSRRPRRKNQLPLILTQLRPVPFASYNATSASLTNWSSD